MGDTPQVLHSYQNHHLDSTRWESYRPRRGDIVVSTSYKSGTTWMQTILINLVFQSQEVPEYSDVSPWVGMRIRPLEKVIETLEGQKHRRVIKSHLALDGLPYYPEVQYIVVARDARDVFMSLWNHYRNYTEDFMAQLNRGQVGDALPACPDDIHQFWRQWIARGWFEWESDGYPFWGNLHHTRTWWSYRHLPNILFTHYNDLQKDPPGEIRHIATFLKIPVSNASLAAIVDASSFSNMKAIAVASDKKNRLEQDLAPSEDFDTGFKGGETAFIFKGTNGRWRTVLDEEDQDLYRGAMTRTLTTECATWLEHGRLSALSGPETVDQESS